MTSFEKYIDEMERRRDLQKADAINRELYARLQELSYEDVMKKLVSSISYPGVTGDLLLATVG